MVIDLKEDRLGENLRADERVVYRAPRGHGRLNRRALKIQAFIGLVVFVAISLFDGQWSIETLVIFGGLIGLQIYQYLAYDLAITDQRLIWMSNRWFGDAQSTWLKDIEQVDVVWNPFFPILEVSGDLGKLLSTGNFPDVGAVAERLVGLCQPKRRFVPSRGLMKSIDLLIGFTLFIIILAVLSLAVVLIAAMASADGFFGAVGYLVLMLLAIPVAVPLAGALAMLLAALLLRPLFNEDPFEVFLYAGPDPRRPGLDGRLQHWVAVICSIVLTIGLARRIRYNPKRYETVRYT